MDPDEISEELFDEFIEIDDEKENVPTNADISKQPRVTKAQYERMDQFHKDHSEALVEGAVFNELWTELAATLNDNGPPVHTTTEWRRKWAIRKYNNKRKLQKFSEESLDDEAPLSKEPKADQFLSGEASGFEKNVVEKLDQILSKLEVIENQCGSEKKQCVCVQRKSK